MRRWLLLVMATTLVWEIGCGGGSSTTAPTTTTAVTISPAATQTVTQGGTVTFTATVNSTNTTTGVVTNITSTGVTWQVDGTAGGTSATGTISTLGVYTAPAAVNVGSIHTVTAVSVADTSAVASTLVDVEPQPQITIAPTTATVAAGQSQPFTPTIGSTVTNPVVSWYVGSTLGGNSTIGTVTQQGVYTAPQLPPVPGGQVVVGAVLNGGNITTQVAAAAVTDTFSAASLQSSQSLQCAYVFLLRGENKFGPFVRAGSFIADGKGGITGIEDINGGGATATAVQFAGTYSVTADGRGTILFHDSYGSHFGATDSSFTLAMVSAQQVQIAEADTFATASGEADLQSSCSPAPTAFSGEYVFDFSGTDASARPLSIVGEFNSVVNGAAQPGVKDINDNGILTPNSPFTVGYQLGNTGGRGTATVVDTSGTTNFSFYMISTNRLRFIELDSSPVVAGDAVAQTPTSGFSVSDLGGNSLVTTSGVSPLGFITTAASFFPDGLGNLQTGTLVQNDAGTVTTGMAFTGTYTVAANGRGTATFSSGQTYVFYLIAEHSAVFQETDSGIVSDGLLVSLFYPPPPLTSVTGSFALQWTGAGTSLGEQDATGQFLVASGQFKSGTLDSNTANGINFSLGFTPSASISLTPTTPYPLSGAPPGPITITVGSTNLQFAVFFTSQTSAVLLRLDTSDVRALSGVIAKQF